MRTHRTIVGFFIGLTVVLAGCAAPGLARTNAVQNDLIVGNWRGPNGDVYVVRRGAGSSYVATVTQTGGTKNALDVGLIDVNGQTFCQIPIGEGADDAPLYHFGLLAITDDVIQHRPVDAQWLNEHTGSDNGCVVCNDPVIMRDILAQAVRDRAFGPTETLRRVHD